MISPPCQTDGGSECRKNHCGAVFAEGLDSQTVGYTITESNWIQPIGVAFKAINQTGKWTNVDTVFGQPINAMDTIMVLNLEKFDYDSYIYNGAGKGWTYMTPDMEAQETNPDADPITVPVESFETGIGEGVMYMPADGMSTMTVSGETEDVKETQTVEFSGNWIYEFANPFPIDTKLSDFETFFKPMDTLMVLNIDKFDYDSYIYNGAGKAWTYMTPDMEAQETNPDADPITVPVEDTSLVAMPANTSALFMPSDSSVDYTWEVTLGK